MALSAASIIRDFPELHPIQQELRKQIRLSRSGNPRVLTWFNLNSGREHFYIMKKCKDYEVFAHFWSLAEVLALGQALPLRPSGHHRSHLREQNRVPGRPPAGPMIRSPGALNCPE